MIRKCFTVNPNRKKEQILDYEKMLKEKIYVGCEFFYPYNKTKEEQQEYLQNISSYLKYNCEFVCHLPYGKDNNLATNDNLDVVMDRMCQAIDYASNLPVTKLTLHPGELDGTLSKEEAVCLASRNIKKLCKYASKYNMIIMLENLVGAHELMKTPEEYFELKLLIDEPNLKFIFDVAHYYASNQEVNYKKDIIQFVETVKDDLYHLHISDNDGTRDQHARIGLGTIDFNKYFKKLESIKYEGLYSSEILFNTADDLRINALLFDKALEGENN